MTANPKPQAPCPTPLLEPLRLYQAHLAAGRSMIEDRDSGLLRPLRPRLAQRELVRMAVRQAAAGRPVRIIVPKSRKQGISSIVQDMASFLCEILEGRRAMTFAHTREDTESIFQIAQTIQEHKPQQDVTVKQASLLFPSGSSYKCRTASGRGTARGSTIHYLHISELAYLEENSRQGLKAMVGIRNAVPKQPHTIVIIESTGSGPDGEFYNQCMAAREGKSDFELLFIPWFWDEGYRLTEAEAAARDQVLATDPHPGALPRLAQREPAPILDWMRGMQAKYRLDEDQIRWYANEFRDQAGDGRDRYKVALFKREYPTTLEDCFEVAGGRVYPGYDDAENWGQVKITAEAVRYRAIDFGSTVEHPFVCLWVAHFPTRKPGIILNSDPQSGCGFVRHEFLNYRRSEKTGRPVKGTAKDHDHAMDALRILIVRENLTGLVYVYRCYVNYNPDDIAQTARDIHRLSGWKLPPGVDEADLTKVARGEKGERYRATVADRNRLDTIRQFRKWRMPEIRRSKPPEVIVIGEVEDGIGRVSNLLSGKALVDAPKRDKAREIRERLLATGRPPDRQKDAELTEEEERILEEDEQRRLEGRGGAGSEVDPADY